MKLKLDLHTHCQEATCFAAPGKDVAREIVSRIKAVGLDGIAVTDHYGKDYSFKLRDAIQELYGDEVLIIPGQEVTRIYYDMVELYLPGNTTFRFMAHPGHPHPDTPWMNYLNGIHGLEVASPHPFNRYLAKEVGLKNGLLLLSNSDAHLLDEIGQYYNEIELSELYARSEPMSGEKPK